MLSELIGDLVAKEMSETDIALRIGLSQPSVNRIKKGKQQSINFSAADALRALHREKCPERYAGKLSKQAAA